MNAFKELVVDLSNPNLDQFINPKIDYQNKITFKKLYGDLETPEQYSSALLPIVVNKDASYLAMMRAQVEKRNNGSLNNILKKIDVYECLIAEPDADRSLFTVAYLEKKSLFSEKETKIIEQIDGA